MIDRVGFLLKSDTDAFNSIKNKFIHMPATISFDELDACRIEKEPSTILNCDLFCAPCVACDIILFWDVLCMYLHTSIYFNFLKYIL